VDRIRTNLLSQATPERAEQEKRYLKSSLEFLGASMPAVNRAAKEFRRDHRTMTRDELWALVHELWCTDTHELRSFAIELMHLRSDLLAYEDLETFERFIRESAGWAHVDEISARLVGSIAERFSEALAVLDRWSKHADFWVRRASMLALLLPLRGGDLSQWDRFASYAASMIDEKEFFIRKAIGWVLRETSKKNPEPVEAFLAEHLGRVSGLTLREGAKYLPSEAMARLRV
jgi:3-methyladenine DNA glycosylase AlkD